MKISLRLGDVMLYADEPVHPGTAPLSGGKWNVSNTAMGVIVGDPSGTHVVFSPEEWNTVLTALAMRQT